MEGGVVDFCGVFAGILKGGMESRRWTSWVV